MQATLPVTFDPALGSQLLRNQGHKEMVWKAVKKNNDPFCPSTLVPNCGLAGPRAPPRSPLGLGNRGRSPLANARICGQLETSDDFMSRRQPPPPSEPASTTFRANKAQAAARPPGSYKVHNNSPLPPSRPFSYFSPKPSPSAANRPPPSSRCCRPRRGATPDLVFGGFHSSFAPPHPHRTWHLHRPLCETPRYPPSPSPFSWIPACHRMPRDTAQPRQSTASGPVNMRRWSPCSLQLKLCPIGSTGNLQP